MNALQKFSNEKECTRKELALRYLFERENRESSFQHQKELDVFSIHKLLPQFTKQEISEHLEIVGDIPHRKAVTLRLLLWQHTKKSAVRKRDLITDTEEEVVTPKILRLENSPSNDETLETLGPALDQVHTESEDSVASDSRGNLVEILFFFQTEVLFNLVFIKHNFCTIG